MPISEYLKNLRAKVGREILQVPSAAALVRDAGGRVLLVKSASADVWGLPAGAIDLGETPEEAVVREVFEETNLRVTPLRIEGVFGGKDFRYVYANGDAVEYFIVVFECAVTSGELAARDGEVSELRYFAPVEMPALAIPYPPSLFQ
jgi:8-oxo-dGTP pyrophosphatase MutT (NUDIX family)